ncbi:MAG: hypothetical protein JNM41_13430 [Flavipsychrobacter sp.]|nr:hypothetical protein [Flavipsychrobacter sp.]
MRNIHKTLHAILLVLFFSLPAMAAEWVKFDNKEGGFKALFPRQPVKTEQEVSGEKGTAKLILYLYDGSKYKNESEVYGVGYVDQIDTNTNSDMDDADIDNLLHSSLAGAAKNMSGETMDEKEIYLKGYRGREGKIHVTEGNYIMIMRTFLVQKRLYLLEAAYEVGKDNPQSIEKFFNAFTVDAPEYVKKEKAQNNNWVTFGKKEFSILFPEQPEEGDNDIETKIGPMKMHTVTYETGKYKDDNEAYALMYTDYPEGMVSSDFKDELIDSFFSNAIRGMVKKRGYKTADEKKITLKGYPGRSVKVDMVEEKAVMNLRIYIVNSRVYILQTLCYKEKDENAMGAKYFNSFALVGGK